MFDSIITFAQETQNSGTSFMETVWWIASVVGLWKMFEKASQPGWPALIPFYDTYKMCEITMGNPWYWLRLLVVVVPFVGWIAALYFAYQMYKAVAVSYGKPETWAWGLLFLTPVFFCLLGFGDAEYYGPMGAGDTRTSQARSAKTVNFEVMENRKEEPVPQYKEPVVEEVKPEESDVDFTFDEPVE